MSPPAKPAPRRKHVTTACLPCRRSKIKCDGLTPACSNCVTKGSDCRYQMGDDRRKLSLRVAVELLCRRAEQLGHFIEENGMQVPAMPNDDEAMLQRTLSAVGVSYDKICTGQRSSSSPSNANQDAVGVEQANGNPVETDLVFDMSRGTLNQEANAVPEPAAALMIEKESGDHRPASIEDHEPDFGVLISPQISNISQGRVQSAVLQPEPLDRAFTIFGSYSETDNGEGDDVEELVDLLSDRMGSLQIGADGQIRYYGPTSNYGLLNMSSTDPLHIHRSIRNDGQEYLDRLDVGAEVPPELEEHLVNLYFTWQDASFRVVDRKMYETGKLDWHRKKRDTPYYSEALRNSICAIGAAFESKHHPDFVTFPKSLGDFFADRAKTLLDIELDSPCVATAQAMVVTSCHDIGCTRDARAWLFSGMAIRLAFDLGLHKDLTPYVQKGTITPGEADLRRTIFWGAYVVDQAWAFYLGRQFKINMEEVTCAKPSGDFNAPESDQWMAYPTSQQQLRNGLMKEVSRQRVLLCEIMAPLGYYLYSDSKIVPAKLQILNEATVKQLSQWKEDLPEALKIDIEDRITPYLPHVLMIHMIYYQDVIYAHRPWMSRTYIQPSPPQGPGSNHARHACIDAAISIAKILEGYETRYTFRRVNTQAPIITCSAALMLIFANVTQYGRSQGLNIPRYLSICFRALEEFGYSWESAKRARVFLLKLQQQWDSKARARRKLRKNSEFGALNNDTTHSNTRKRPLTATGFGSNQFGLDSAWPNQRQPHGLEPSVDDSIGLDFDANFDWIMEDNEQTAPGGSSSGRSNTAFPFDFIGLLGDTRFS